MRGFLCLMQLLTMVVWVGGLIFFAFVLAPSAFHILPNAHEAGLIVGETLKRFNVVAEVCAGVFLAATGLLFRSAPMRVRGRYEMQFLLTVIMVLGTGYLQTNVMPTMDEDRVLAGGDIQAVGKDHPARIHFDRLHARSERVEGAVLLIGLGVLFLMSREQIPLVSTASASTDLP